MPQKLVYLDNRPMDGQAGFFVVTPLQLDPAPACGPAWVMVQRGWVPRHQVNRQQLPPVDTPHDLVVVTGHVIKDISQAYALGAEPRVAAHVASPLLRQNMGREAWAEWMGVAPAPGAVLQADSGASNSPASTSNQLKRAWPAPDSGVGKHHAYAAQWFALALIITGLYVWFQLLRPRRAS
jgi:surfeit locus 1 family protein